MHEKYTKYFIKTQTSFVMYTTKLILNIANMYEIRSTENVSQISETFCQVNKWLYYVNTSGKY